MCLSISSGTLIVLRLMKNKNIESLMSFSQYLHGYGRTSFSISQGVVVVL